MTEVAQFPLLCEITFIWYVLLSLVTWTGTLIYKYKLVLNSRDNAFFWHLKSKYLSLSIAIFVTLPGEYTSRMILLKA